MTDSVLTPYISNCQIQKFIQAGLFSCDTDVVLLTKKEKKRARSKAWRDANPEKKKAYHESTKEKAKAYSKEYYELNKAKKSLQGKVWYAENKVKKYAKHKKWQTVNAEKRKESSRKLFSAYVRYDIYQEKLQMYENIQQDKNGVLLVLCAYCGKPFPPLYSQVTTRLGAINNTCKGEGRFYCSNLCKVSCPTYGRILHYKFQNIGHSREVPAEFRQMALKDRDYTCETCGLTENGLHVHHINGYTEMPMLMADLSNVKVLCATCHKAVHSVPGCLYVDYSCARQR